MSTPVREVVVVLLFQDVMGSSVVRLLVRHPAVVRKERLEIYKQKYAHNTEYIQNRIHFQVNLYSRSAHYSDGGHPVETVTAHQVGDVIMELCLLA